MERPPQDRLAGVVWVLPNRVLYRTGYSAAFRLSIIELNAFSWSATVCSGP